MMAIDEGLPSDHSSKETDASRSFSSSDSSRIAETDMNVEKHSPEAKEDDDNKVGSFSSFKLFGVIIEKSCAQSNETIKTDNTQKDETSPVGFDRKRKLPSDSGVVTVALNDGSTLEITSKESKGKETVDTGSMVITVAWNNASSRTSTSRKDKESEISTRVSKKTKIMAAKKQIAEGGQQQTRLGASRRQNLQESEEGPWSIQKTLTYSDVDQSCRLLIGKQLMDRKVLPFMTDAQAANARTKEGVAVQVFDVVMNSKHQLVLKQWKTGSFVFTSNWTKDFVKNRNLKVNDKIGLSWDAINSRFNFSVLERSNQGEASSSAVHSS